MPITRDQVALNAIQWINLPPEPGQPQVWLYNEPSWRAEQPGVHRKIREAGFDAVMIEVLDTQTLQNYERMLREAQLRPAPGYVQVTLPELHGLDIRPGSAEWVRWFDQVRRRAEETNYLGLDSVFIAAEVAYDQPRFHKAVAQGIEFDQDRLERHVEVFAEAATVLKAEGVRAGLHNHVGTWIETEHEIEYVLANIDASLLGASLDIGHLAWAGIDYVDFLRRHRDRLLDLHIKDLDLEVARQTREHDTSYTDASNRRLFLEPGLGQIDFAGVFAAIGDDFPGWLIIEVDRATMEPFESAKFSWEWVTRTIPAEGLRSPRQLDSSAQRG